jgi:hypothetical protein
MDFETLSYGQMDFEFEDLNFLSDSFMSIVNATYDDRV